MTPVPHPLPEREPTRNPIACPGCGYIGGQIIPVGGRYWHERCRREHLEAELAKAREITDEVRKVGLALLAEWDGSMILTQAERRLFAALEAALGQEEHDG
jgi:hypothetical protein